MQQESDSEEEILVYAEFEDSVNIDKYRAIHVLGEDEKNPIIQLDDTFFMGKYEHALGTYMFFEEDTIEGKDIIFDKYPEKCVKYICQTRKLINMEHAHVTPKEGKDTNNQNQVHKVDDDVQPVMFSSIQHATDHFKEYFVSYPASSSANEEKPVTMEIDSTNVGNNENIS